MRGINGVPGSDWADWSSSQFEVVLSDVGKTGLLRSTRNVGSLAMTTGPRGPIVAGLPGPRDLDLASLRGANPFVRAEATSLFPTIPPRSADLEPGSGALDNGPLIPCEFRG